MNIPPLKDNDEPKLMYWNGNTFTVITWNDTHVDVYEYDGASDHYQRITSYQRHIPTTK